MNINLQEIIPTYHYSEGEEGLKYFTQFNIYETVQYNNYSCKSRYSSSNLCKNLYPCNHDIEVCKIDYTCPCLNIISTKIVNTIEGVSLEGQNLTGKKLVILGEIELSLILTYKVGYNQFNKIIKDTSLAFSTFIIVPNEMCYTETINLRYLVEDISVVHLCTGKILVSVTLLIEYIDEYL